MEAEKKIESLYQQLDEAHSEEYEDDSKSPKWELEEYQRTVVESMNDID